MKPASSTIARFGTSHLGQYRLVRKLGTGGMAEVFLAAHRMGDSLTRPVVIKAILPHLGEDDRFVEMFLREARVAAMLSHPNIVHIHDVTRLDGRPCLVMEFLKGRDLWTVLSRLGARGEAVPPEAAAATIAQAASGLDYAHRKRDRAGQPLDLVHRDISPHNIFLTREGHVRVLDFGIAKSAFQESKTESGIIKGKLPYMAPEQARGKDVDGRADQFALGILLWEMLTGQRLFARDDPVLTMTAMFHEPVPKPSSLRPCPEVLERIVMRTLKRSPTDRFDSCESLANALRGWMASSEAGSESRLVRRLLAHAIPPQEDEAFYAPDRPQEDGEEPIPSEELRLVGVEVTPSGIDSRVPELDDAPRPPPPELTPTASPRPTPKVWLIAVAGVALVGLAFGVTVLALRPAEAEQPAMAVEVVDPPTTVAAAPELARGPSEAAQAEAAHAEATQAAAAQAEAAQAEAAQAEAAYDSSPVVIRFLDVPDGVVIEVDGGALEGSELRVIPSDEVHHVRALVRGREVWRYDGLFRRAGEVRVPPLDLEPARAERPSMASTRSTPRRRSTSMRPRLGMEIDLGYP